MWRSTFSEISGFFGFWARVLWRVALIGWAVFATVSTFLPDLLGLVHQKLPLIDVSPAIQWANHHPIEAHLWPALTATAIYLLIAPYILHSEQRRKFEDVHSQLGKYTHTPLSVTLVCMDRGLFGARIVNHGDNEEPIESISIHLCGRGSDESFTSMYINEQGFSKLPDAIDRRAKWEVEFTLFSEYLTHLRVEQVYARVLLQDGRSAESERHSICDAGTEKLHFFPVVKSITFSEQMDRDQRLGAFVGRFKMDYAINKQGMCFYPLDSLKVVGIASLRDNKEIRDAIERLDVLSIPHSLTKENLTKDVLGFFRKATDENFNLRGMEGILEFCAWFGEPITRLLPSPISDTEAPKLEPSSLTCPETDTHCSDC